MSSATPAIGASEVLARFICGAHAGADFDEAIRSARAALAAARTPPAPTETSDLAMAAVASGPSVISAYGTAIVLAEAPNGRRDAPIVAAAIVASERRAAGPPGRNDESIAEAIAIGREVAARLERALRLDAAWDADALVAGIGATAAAARAFGLDATATQHAIGLAATQAGGLGVTEGTTAAILACGKAANDAIEAALLAQHGFTAASASLEGRRGLAALMASHFDAAALCDGLGRSLDEN